MPLELASFLSALSCNHRPRRRRSARPKRLPVAAEILEDRVLLVGDAFEYTFEGTLAADADITAQVVGDFTGDNLEEIASFDANTGQWIVSVNTLGASNQRDFDNQIWDDFITTSGWQNQVVGDFNGDSTDDIAQFNTLNGTWHVSLAVDDPVDISPLRDSFLTQQWDDFQTTVGWVNQIVGDFNDDGFDDIANFNSFNATWWVSIATDGPDDDLIPDQFVTSLWIDYPTDFGWQNPVVGNFDSDGIDDIAHFNTINGTWWVLSPIDAAGGANDEDAFDISLWDDIQTTMGWTAQIVGDFDQDGSDDIANFNELNNTWHVSRSNLDNSALPPAARESFSTRLWSELPAGNYTNHLVGDFNGNTGLGFADDVASFDANTGRWYIGLSNGGQFETDVWSDFPTNTGWTFQHVGNFSDSVEEIEDGILSFNALNNSLWQSIGTFGLRNTTNFAISNASAVESTIEATGLSGTIIDVNVQIALTHDSIFDLDAVLIGPSGVAVPLFANVGQVGDAPGVEDVINGAFLDDEAAVAYGAGPAQVSEIRLRPEGPLSNFDGLDPNATWTLRIVDEFANNDGTLLEWSLIIKTAIS